MDTDNNKTSPTIGRSRALSNSAQRLKRASASFMEQQASGFFNVTAGTAVNAPTIKDIQQEASSPRPSTTEQNATSYFEPVSPTIDSNLAQAVPPTISEHETIGPASERSRMPEMIPEVTETSTNTSKKNMEEKPATVRINSDYSDEELGPLEDDEPQLTKGQAFVKLMKLFWSFFCTIKGFLITIYFLLIVAWGGMIFLLLCNAAPAMTKQYGANDNRSARKIWMEIDSQVLNALFCVTGFGLAPWRLRDLILLMQYRIQHKQYGLDKLTIINRSWFRKDDKGPILLTPVQEADEAENDAEAGLSQHNSHKRRRLTRSGKIAPATRYFWMDVVVWSNVGNTIFQTLLAFFMWHYNRINRPTFATPLFIVLAFGCGIANGVIIWRQGARIKKIEGRPLQLQQSEASPADTSEKVDKKQQEGSWFKRHWKTFRAGTD